MFHPLEGNSRGTLPHYQSADSCSELSRSLFSVFVCICSWKFTACFCFFSHSVCFCRCRSQMYKKKYIRLCIDQIWNMTPEPESLLSSCSSDDHGGAVLHCENRCPWKHSASASLQPTGILQDLWKKAIWGAYFPPEIVRPIKVQITNTLSVLEQCNRGFVDVMIISVSIVFALCAKVSSHPLTGKCWFLKGEWLPLLHTEV